MATPDRAEPAGPKHAAIAAIARAQADLERAVEEIDRLPALDAHSIALSAHALNNFLTVSRAVIDFLLPVLRLHPERQIAVWLEGLAHATDLMTHTVSQLMNNTVGAEATLRLEEVDVARLVERTCAYYQRAAERKGIVLSFRDPSDLPTVHTDRVFVAAVLDNLLSNALKYSPVNRHVWIDVRAERDGVSCSVRDEGPGLGPAEQEQLFQPGVRLGPQPSGGESSTGYGLAIAKHFMDLLGGALTCVSAAGEGATFTLWLPRVPPQR